MYGADADGAADLGQRDTRDEARAALGELALVELGVVAEELDRDGLPEDRVAEELEALVGGDAAVLVRERPVREREQEQGGVDVDAAASAATRRARVPRAPCAPFASRPVESQAGAD